MIFQLCPLLPPENLKNLTVLKNLIPRIQRFHSVTNEVHGLVPSRVWAWHKTTRLVPQARPTSGLGCILLEHTRPTVAQRLHCCNCRLPRGCKLHRIDWNSSLKARGERQTAAAMLVSRASRIFLYFRCSHRKIRLAREQVENDGSKSVAHGACIKSAQHR